MAAPAPQKIDINTATKEQLQTAVSAAVADVIISKRPLRSFNALKDVKGVGEGKV